MTVLIKKFEMADYNHSSIPGEIMVTFTNGEEVRYRQINEKETGIPVSNIKLLNFQQPNFDVDDVKINENTFEALADGYADQLCILNMQHKSALEEAERLYIKEKVDLDDFCKSQHIIIEELWNKMSQEMSWKYQNAKKMVDQMTEGLKDPAQRLEVMMRWLRKTELRGSHQAVEYLEKTAQYIIKKIQFPEIKWHSFLSHVQRDSGDVCRNIRDTLLPKGMRLWYDRNQDRLDFFGMIDGVVDSSLFTLILTKDYFSRPYCIFEYCVAVLAGKKVITVYEADTRYGGGPIDSFKLPELSHHLMRHELIDINRNYWEAFICKLENRIQNTLTSAQKVILEKPLSGSNAHTEEIKLLKPISASDCTSSILNDKEFLWLSEKLQEEGRKMWRRIFISSNDGNTVKAFREKCDLRGATLTLIETTDGKVFGGFTSRSWDKKKKYGVYAAKSAWLFTLREGPFKKINIKPENIYRAVMDGKTEFIGEVYGPIFGNLNFKHDLAVSPGMEFEGDVCFCEGPASYSSGIMTGENKVHFIIKEWEVFEVNSCQNVI